MRERQDFEQIARSNFLHDIVGNHAFQRVVDRLGPRVHLLHLITRQIAQVLPADGVERTEDDDALVIPALQNRLQACAQRQRGLASAGAAADGDDAHGGVEKQIERNPLLCGATGQPEGVDVPAHEAQPAARRNTCQRRLRTCLHPHATVHR